MSTPVPAPPGSARPAEPATPPSARPVAEPATPPSARPAEPATPPSARPAGPAMARPAEPATPPSARPVEPAPPSARPAEPDFDPKSKMVAEHYAIHPWFTKQVGEPKDAKSAPVTWNRNWSQDMRELRSFKAVSQKLAANEATLRESEAKVATLQEQLKELRQKHESDTQNLQQRATVLHSDMEALLKTQKERHEEELQRAQREKTIALEELTRQKDEEYDEVMQDLLSEKVRRQRAKNKARAAKEQAGHAGIDRHAGHAGLNLVTWQAGNIAQQKAELMAREKLLAKQASSDRAVFLFLASWSCL